MVKKQTSNGPNTGNISITIIHCIQTDPAQVRNVSHDASRTEAMLSWAPPAGGSPNQYEIRLESDEDGQYASPGVAQYLNPSDGYTYSMLLPATNYTFYITSVLDPSGDFLEQRSEEKEYEFRTGKTILPLSKNF